MQLTIGSDEPLDRVLAVVGALYGVRLTVEQQPTDEPGQDRLLTGEDDRITKTRH
jgi:hypothetical protein